MTAEEPEVWIDVEFGDDFTLAILTTLISNKRDTIHHEHIGKGKAGIARTKHGAMGTGKQVITIQ